MQTERNQRKESDNSTAYNLGYRTRVKSNVKDVNTSQCHVVLM